MNKRERKILEKLYWSMKNNPNTYLYSKALQGVLTKDYRKAEVFLRNEKPK